MPILTQRGAKGGFGGGSAARPSGLFGTINAVNQTPWGQQGNGFAGTRSEGMQYVPGVGLRPSSGGQSSGSAYGPGIFGQIAGAEATNNAQQYRAGQNQPSWGGGNVMGGMAQGQTTGTFTNAQGQTQSTLNGGARTMGSVNWGAVAGIQNYLNTINPAQRQQASDYLRSQGLMPTYNGFQLDRMPAQQTLGQPGGFDANAPGYFGSDGTYWVNQGNGNYVSQAQAEAQVASRGGGGYGAEQERPWTGTPGAPVSIPGGSLSFNPNSGIDNYGRGPYGGQGGGYGGGSSGATFPLEARMEQSINGILDNPSPYSAQQTQMMRNRSTAGIDQQRMEAQRQAGADAARRGLSPQEAAANQSALGASYDRTRQGVQQDFELNNALASRQGLMQGLGAGQGLLGQQFQNEDSIRRYLAMLGQTQAGNAPLFVQSL